MLQKIKREASDQPSSVMTQKTMIKPRFTFCIPNLNKIKYLPACIESVLAQDCEDWCCVFVDGYSTDGSWEYMQQFASDTRFMLRRGIRQGMYADWNECLKYVDTEYFYFLTSDDTCFQRLVSTTTTVLDIYPDIKACHFKFNLINSIGETIKFHEEIVKDEFPLYHDVNKCMHQRSGTFEFFMHLLYGTIYRTITSLVLRKTILSVLKNFSSIYGSIGDYDWTMRLGLFTDIIFIPECLATWRIYEGQATQGLNSSLHKKRTLEIAKKNTDLFIQNQELYITEPFRSKQGILSNYYDDYARCLLEEFFVAKAVDESAIRLYAFLANSPIYLFKKIINRLSQGRFYQYRGDKRKFALDLVDRYGLAWPPVPLHSESKKSNLEI